MFSPSPEHGARLGPNGLAAVLDVADEVGEEAQDGALVGDAATHALGNLDAVTLPGDIIEIDINFFFFIRKKKSLFLQL